MLSEVESETVNLVMRDLMRNGIALALAQGHGPLGYLCSTHDSIFSALTRHLRSLLLATALLLQALSAGQLFGQTADSPPNSQAPYDQLQNPEAIKPIPVLQTSAAFQTVFDAGETHIHPLLTPVLLVPFGERWLFEARGTFESDLSQQPAASGFHGVLQKEEEYAQLDFIASPYMTVTVGRFLTPFGIFNERLYPVWIRNLASDPLILPIGIDPSNASTGAMIRGGFKATEHFNVNYTLYYSTLSTVSALDSSRFAGGRGGIFIPKARLEIGGSYQHLLQDDHSNLFGFHMTWQPPRLPLDLRAETARSSVGRGYWVESAYRLTQVPFARNQLRHTQVVARMQQFFIGPIPANSVLPVNTNMFEFGANYYFMDGLRAMSSYGRQFAPQGNGNVWTLALTYRLVVTLGRGEVQ